MIAALDVQYTDHQAAAATVTFAEWSSTELLTRYTAILPVESGYQPGMFFLRELPPLQAVLDKLQPFPDVLVIDAYCHLSADGEPGLGLKLHETLGGRCPIIGVAKNRYRGTNHAREVCRGDSKRPLFVTAVGMTYDEAADRVRSMAGEFRVPSMIKLVDQLARATAKLSDNADACRHASSPDGSAECGHNLGGKLGATLPMQDQLE